MKDVNRAYKLDLDEEEKIHLAEMNCILPNNLNTKPERDRANRKRMESRIRSATEKTQQMNELNDINFELECLTQAQKDTKDRAKELREKKKGLQTASGIKRTSPKKINARGKARAQASFIQENTNDDGNRNHDGPEVQVANYYYPSSSPTPQAPGSTIQLDFATSDLENLNVSSLSAPPPEIDTTNPFFPTTGRDTNCNLFNIDQTPKKTTTSQPYLSPTRAILSSMNFSPPRRPVHESPLW